MRSWWWRLVACVVCGLVGVGSWSAVARAEEAATVSGSGSSVFSNPTVVVGAPEEAQELQYEREARFDSPEAVRAREASRTVFEGLSAEQAVRLAGESFPQIVDVPAGGSPQLPAGQRIVGYSTPNTAQLELPEHKSGVLESLSPIAIETSSSTRVPVDLSLNEEGGLFRPVRGLVGIDIPKRLADGISLSDRGVSLTPVDGQGQSFAGSEGSIVGASVLYANTQLDTDTLVKPTTDGFDVDALLRSVQSPEQLDFRVGMPVGAELASDGQGGAFVMLEGQRIASVLPPMAQDAAGSSVPVSMSVSGDLLVVSVDHDAGSYQYPIFADPSIIDPQLAQSGAKRANWEFESEPTGSTEFGHTYAVCKGPGEQYLETCSAGAYKEKEFASWVYQTRGNSKIFEFKGETEAENTSARIESLIELQDNAVTEEKEQLSTELKEPKYIKRALPEPLCPKGKATCSSIYGGEKNAVHFQQSVTANGGSKFSDYLYAGEVSISEPEEHSTTKYNTTSPELEGEVVNSKGEKEKLKRKNVMDGGGWLSERDGAAELISEDKGIGVSATQLEFESSPGKWEQLAKHNYLIEEHLCKGYQCEPKDEEFWVLNPKLPNGEDKIRYRAEDGMGASTESTESEGIATVKVDTSKPRKLTIAGLPYGNELSERPYNLTVLATDGEGSTVASSGIESIALYIDGGLIGTNGGTGGKEGTEGKCSEPKGECTASAKWTFDGAELGAGKHQIEVVAHDRAGNEERFYDPVSIRHSTPVALGPGSVDLESGDYAMSATDVSMGSGLTLSRSYSSRDLTQGDSGPLGPEWGLSMSSAESLVELVDGGVLLTSANGKQTIFAGLGSGKFESPVGDSNLELTLEENKETKQKLAYYLKNSAAGTSVKFTQPPGSTGWVPTRQEGAVSTDTVTYAYQTGQAYEEGVASSVGGIAGADGATWIAVGNNIVKQYPGNGRVEYHLEAGSDPEMLAADQFGNVWFVEDGQKGIGAITPRGEIINYPLRGKETKYYGITSGPEGDMWSLAEEIEGVLPKFKLVKISTTGGEWSEYTLATEGVSEPIAGPEGNIWTADGSAIIKITPTGTATKVYAVPAGSSASGVVAGSDGNMWFTNTLANKIGKLTTSGTLLAEYALPAKSEPTRITAGPDGNLWFDETQASKIGKITPEGVIAEYSVGPEPGAIKPYTIVVGPENNIWYGGSELGLGRYIYGMVPLTGLPAEPTEALAPVPPKVSCTPMKAGCRALKFKYATKTTNPNSCGLGELVGEYAGHLNEVFLDAYNPVAKEMQETLVAHYYYDGCGRLVEEVNPRSSVAYYGYDEEGHLTAVSPPGQEPWILTYGQTATDSGTGRLIKIMRVPASTIRYGNQVKNTEVPKITGSPYEGVRLAVSNGKWEGEPVAYSYQWEDCNSYVEACKNIPGATNPNYTVKSSDENRVLEVSVTATSRLGSATVLSSPSEEVTLNPISIPLPSGSKPTGITNGPEGYLWYTDRGTGKIGRLPGEFPGDGDEPEGITAGPDGNLWFVEQAVGHINHITPTGTLTTFTLTRSNPGNVGIAVGTESYLWFTESRAGYVGKINTKDEVLGEYAVPPGSTPDDIVEGSDENMWFTEYGTSKIAKITKTGAISEFKLPSGSEPYGIAAGPDKNLWFTDYGTNKIGKITTTGTITEYALPAGSEPRSIAVGPEGEMWFTDFGTSKVGRITTSGVIAEYASAAGSQPYGIATSGKYVYYTDYGTNAVSKIAGTTEGEVEPPQPGYAIEYGVPLEGSGAPAQMGVNPTTQKHETAQWGQTEDVPVEATSIFPPDSPQGWPASNYTRATTYYLDEAGRVVNVANPSNGKYGSISTAEYNEENDVTRTLTPDNRASALEAGENSTEVATLLSTFNTYKNKCSKESEFNEERESSEFGTRLCETEGPEHMVKYTGIKGQEEGEARDHVRYFYDEKVPSEGPNKESFSKETFNLLTETQNLTEILGSKGRVEQEIEPRTTVTSYSGQNNLGWKLRAPTSVTTDTETGGQKLKSQTLYNEEGQVTETRSPAGEAGNSAHDAKIVYYTAENESEVENCRKHPEWAGLVCQTLPVKQPETSGIPNLPVTETTYNMWDEPETATETFTFPPHPTVVRTRKDTYDTAGRLASSETTVTGNEEDKTLPKVTYEYQPNQGMLDAESATINGKTKTVSSKFNTLGQLTEYTDASGENTAKYVYGGPENDFQIQEVSDSSNGAKSRQTYTYNKNTMQLETLWDSAAETFTATYDTEGKLTSETYPNGMCANYTYNSVGQATHLEYIKTTNCSEKSAPVWYSETIGSTVRGETLNRTSTLATENYTYDTLGRLTETQETPAGGECSVRLYEYEKESNRTKLTSRKPTSKGECATTGGTEEKHTYDEANRMTDTGIEYEGLGNITKLPAADAEGHELKSTFYTDGTVASQTQNGVTNEYGLDPTGRISTTTTGGKATIDHYDGSGEAIAWACEAATGTETCETGHWTRNIPGIDGSLAAVQTNGTAPVLQLHDLKGNVIATAELNPSATKLLSTYNSTEFGVPNNEKTPPTFAWLGAADLSKSLSSGVITYGATSYVPQAGRTLQTEPVQSPGYPTPIGGGTYATFTAEPWNLQGGTRVETEAPGIAAAESREAAVAALEACGESGICDPPKTLYFDAEEVAVICGVLNAEDVALVPIEIIELVTIKLSDVEKALFIEIIKELTSIHSPVEWADAITTDLNACLGVMVSGHGGNLTYARCRITTPWSEVPILGFEVPNLFGMPTAGYCLYYAKHCGVYESNGEFLFPSGKTL